MSLLPVIVGMEVHVELKTASKMFCACKNDPFHAPQPNMYVCPVCLGMPGGLPVANKKAIEWTVRLGLALGCEVRLFSKFDRKHYFYPDLPKGYQISQYDQPLCENGKIQTSQGVVRIQRIHLEEDTGKMLHRTVDGKPVSLIDFNRSGVPLVEIVTQADIHSPQQAKEYGTVLRDIIRTLDISDADMEKGSMRLEANISCSADGKTLPNYKVEVKNINSFRFLEQAVAYEQARQSALLEKGGTPTQETRGWNENRNETVSQRKKENAEDYRYFPDPDLPPLHFTPQWVEEQRALLPLLPAQRQEKLCNIGIREEYAVVLTNPAYNIQRLLLLVDKAVQYKITADQVAGFVLNQKIEPTLTQIDEILNKLQRSFTREEISAVELQGYVNQVIQEQPKAVADYKGGKQQVLGFLVGMVMKKVGKKIDTTVVQQLLQQAL